MNIFRTKFLNTAAFLMAPPDETRSAAQIERDSIVVNETTNGREPNETETENEEVVAGKEGEGGEEVEETEEEEDGEEGEVEIVETAEQKVARVAKEREDRQQARIQKRIDKAVAAEKAAKAETEALRKQLAEKPVEGLTEEEVERRAEEKATAKLTTKQKADAQKAFEDTCDKLEAAALKVDKDFSAKVGAMVEEIGQPIPGTMMNIIADLDNENGGEVLSYLTNNIDEAEELYALSERKMTQKLMRLSDKLKEAKKPAPKQRSGVPAPLTPLNEGRSNKTNGPLTGKEDMEQFAKVRAQQSAEYRKSRGGY